MEDLRTCFMKRHKKNGTFHGKQRKKGLFLICNCYKKNLRKNIDGQALVEFVLVLPLLLLLVLGMIEFGWILNGKITLNSAAREGVRVAAVLNTTEVVRKQKVFEAITNTIELSGVKVEQDDVEITEEEDFLEDVQDVIVKVDGTIKPIIGLFVKDTVELNSKARMRRE